MKRSTPDTALTERDLQFLQMGRAAMIPGFQQAIQILQSQLDKMRDELRQLQDVRTTTVVFVGKDHQIEGPPKKRQQRDGTKIRRYWDAMTPEQRSDEMRRRMGLRAGKHKLHPRDARHPDHDKWLKKLSKARKQDWAKLTVRQQKERLKKMTQGKANKQAPVVKLEATA